MTRKSEKGVNYKCKSHVKGIKRVFAGEKNNMK